MLMLTACTRVEYRDREIPVPVIKPLPAEMTADCDPGAMPDTLTVGDVLSRAGRAEDALKECRRRMKEVRLLTIKGTGINVGE